MIKNYKFYQCCGMSLTEKDMISRNQNSNLNENYYKWYFTNGKFNYESKESLIDFFLKHVPNQEDVPNEEHHATYDVYLSQMKHWKNNCRTQFPVAEEI